jgi:hypothetical protein
MPMQMRRLPYIDRERYQILRTDTFGENGYATIMTRYAAPLIEGQPLRTTIAMRVSASADDINNMKTYLF